MQVHLVKLLLVSFARRGVQRKSLFRCCLVTKRLVWCGVVWRGVVSRFLQLPMEKKASIPRPGRKKPFNFRRRTVFAKGEFWSDLEFVFVCLQGRGRRPS
jgi:hypothetical protein